MLVDHFAILGLPPSAGPQEIKSAYRRLVRTCHPDLHPSDLQAAGRFRAIQLAYDTLTRPALRQAYLEKRWYAQSQHQSMEKEPLSLERILQKCLALERFVSKLDVHRMDRNGLRQHLIHSLREWSAVEWSLEQDKHTIEQILVLLIRCCRPLSYADCQTIHQAMGHWLKINHATRLLDDHWLMKRKRAERFQQSLPVWMLLLTVAIAALIWLMG